MNFNPRTHEGYDHCIAHLEKLAGILIPVPVKGTIQSTEALMSAFTILIPVPVKGTILIKLGFPK